MEGGNHHDHGAAGRTMVLKITRRAIWLLTMVVLLGHIMMWIMMPTMVYWKTWLPTMESGLNSTFFGFQGSNLLVHTTPVLFIAVAGSVYLHLGKMLSNNGENRELGAKKNRWGGWMRRSMFLEGPLGIVSRMEVAFVVMFVGLVVWSFSTYLHVGFSLLSPLQIHDDGGKL
ncbi:hypothetical protein Ancab_037894 [Ancistrocladus abbreviatus]